MIERRDYTIAEQQIALVDALLTRAVDFSSNGVLAYQITRKID
jgi:hypothetical protein